MGAWTFEQWTTAIQAGSSALQALALVAGGIWAFLLYHRNRQSQSKVGIELQGVRFDTSAEDLVLLVNLRIQNVSYVLFRLVSAHATLLDASERTPEGEIRLIPFAQEDPFQAVYSTVSFRSKDVTEGQPFVGFDPSKVLLEPGEYVDTELAYRIETNSGLMAMQVMVEGRQGTLTKSRNWWSAYFYITPDHAYNHRRGRGILDAFKEASRSR